MREKRRFSGETKMGVAQLLLNRPRRAQNLRKGIWSAVAACRGEAERRLERSGDTAFRLQNRVSKAARRFTSRRSPKMFAGWSADFPIGRGGTSSVVPSAGTESGVPIAWSCALRLLLFRVSILRSTAKSFPACWRKFFRLGKTKTAKSGTFERHQKLTSPKTPYKSGLLRSFAR